MNSDPTPDVLILNILLSNSDPLTANEIHDTIISKSLYDFSNSAIQPSDLLTYISNYLQWLTLQDPAYTNITHSGGYIYAAPASPLETMLVSLKNVHNPERIVFNTFQTHFSCLVVLV